MASEREGRSSLGVDSAIVVEAAVIRSGGSGKIRADLMIMVRRVWTSDPRCPVFEFSFVMATEPTAW